MKLFLVRDTCLRVSWDENFETANAFDFFGSTSIAKNNLGRQTLT